VGDWDEGRDGRDCIREGGRRGGREIEEGIWADGPNEGKSLLQGFAKEREFEQDRAGNERINEQLQAGQQQYTEQSRKGKNDKAATNRAKKEECRGKAKETKATGAAMHRQEQSSERANRGGAKTSSFVALLLLFFLVGESGCSKGKKLRNTPTIFLYCLTCWY
jgi:hypothetical protein